MSSEPEHELEITQPVWTELHEPDDADARDVNGGGSDGGPDDDTPIAIAPRRRRISIVTTVLAFAVVAGVAFYAGVLVQKHQKSSSSSTSSALNALAALRGGARTVTGGAGGTGAAGAGGAGAANGRGVVGQVKLIDGSNIYVTDFQGNTVKVATNPGSQFSKTDAGSLADVKIGDTVVVQGPQGSDGTYQATRVTIGGAAGTGGFGGFGGGGRFGGGSGAAAGG